MHAYHDALPGFDPQQIWHDGCGECESRSQRLALETLDMQNFQRAWERAYAWNTSVRDLAISKAEAPMLRQLWLVQLQFERLGWPLGELPFVVEV